MVAFATVGLTSAIPTTSQPQLPEGFFAGIYNEDGTTTLTFANLNETYTFNAKSVPTVRRDASNEIEKRAPFGRTDCWRFQTLSRSGVDKGIRAFRDLFNSKPNERGYLGREWLIQYFGYNFDGVYVYFCVNTRDWWSDSFEVADLDHGSYWMDQDCGPYSAGYYQWDSPSLFGKALSGSDVCAGGK